MSRGDACGTWDADRIAQVVSNLVGNALSYSPPHTPVEIGLDAQADEVVLDVQNQGPPIPAEALSTIFAPFNRGRAGAARRARSGLGLGLFIVDRIVQAHGGAIRGAAPRRRGRGSP